MKIIILFFRGWRYEETIYFFVDTRSANFTHSRTDFGDFWETREAFTVHLQ